MTARATNRLACLLLAACFIGPSFGAADSPSPDPKPIDSNTKPSEDVILSFVRPGLRVVEILVKEGDHVQKGQLLAHQDDSEETKALAYYKSKAEDSTQLDAQVIIEKQSQTDYDNMKESHAGSRYEQDHAKLQAEVDAAKIKIAQSQHEQDGYQFEENVAVVEKTKLYAPFDGTAEELLIHQGESVDSQNMKVMRVVNIDPLWVEVAVPFAQGDQLKDGDTAQVTLSNKEIWTGHVIHVASVAESASDTLLVRVELPNPTHRKAGERVKVTFGGAAKVASTDQP